jgi:hypothetical protein
MDAFLTELGVDKDARLALAASLTTGPKPATLAIKTTMLERRG